jgi:hypothetical protein
MNNGRVFFALVTRDFITLKKIAPALFWDNFFLLISSIAIFGHLLPAMGMSPDLITPLFLGQTIVSFVQIAHSIAAIITRDLETSRLIYYHCSLPLPHTLLLARFVVSFVIKSIIITVPLLILGILMLGEKFVIVKTHLISFFVIYLFSLVYAGTLFLLFSFRYDYEWFRWNLWSRRIEPLLVFGSVTVMWKSLYAFSKPLGILFLCNPFTYAAEGLRTAIIGGHNFLPAWVCIIGLLVGIIINWLLLVPAMNKKLDLVPDHL